MCALDGFVVSDLRLSGIFGKMTPVGKYLITRIAGGSNTSYGRKNNR
jgi:hypothetical protein